MKVMREVIKKAFDQGRDKKMSRELQVWTRLRHSNIVPFVGVAFEEDTACPVLISLRMPYGNLKAFLKSFPNPIKEPLLLEIAQGLQYLHNFEKEIIHGDLKAENVFVDGDGSLRIGDFGLSRMLSNESFWVTSATKVAGTIRWMAPELLGDQAPNISKETDIYAFGVTALEIISGQVPFTSYTNDGQVLLAVMVKEELPSRPDYVYDSLWTLLNDCWIRDPSLRIRETRLF